MIMMRYSLLSIAVLLSGCTGLSAPAPVHQTQYLLDAMPEVSASSVKRDAVMVVSATPARPGYDTSRMAYTQRSHELDYYATNRWVAPPARMLEPLLVSALEKTAAFRAVVPASNSLSEDLRLEIELVQLHQDFTMQPSRIELSMRAQLINQHDDRVLAARQFDEVETAASEDARGGAEAANRALKRLLSKLVTFALTESGNH